ncbi:MAG: hypothetical protein Q7J06_00275 [Bacteroidales bacterium]|nr:hypothetical protein [Bacteroidales bacterium]
MKITNVEELNKIKRELEALQDRFTDCVSLEDNEIHTEYDFYNTLSEVVDLIDDLKEVQE